MRHVATKMPSESEVRRGFLASRCRSRKCQSPDIESFSGNGSPSSIEKRMSSNRRFPTVECTLSGIESSALEFVVAADVETSSRGDHASALSVETVGGRRVGVLPQCGGNHLSPASRAADRGASIVVSIVPRCLVTLFASRATVAPRPLSSRKSFRRLRHVLFRTKRSPKLPPVWASTMKRSDPCE